MIFLVMLVVLYGLPVFGGILLFRLIILQFGNQKAANSVTVILCDLLVLLIIAIPFLQHFSRRHALEFQFSDSCKVEVCAFDEDSFQDWPVTFHVAVLNPQGKTIKEIDFTTGEGPYIRFYTDSLQPNKMIIEGYNGNFGVIDKINTGAPNPLSRKIEISGDYKTLKTD